MFNEVILTGRLTADVELKQTPNGVSVASFSIANDIGYGDKKRTNFINIVAWRSTAEFIAKYFKKGNMIGIKGYIQTRKYQDQNGNNRMAFEVVADKAEFMESKKAENNEIPSGGDVPTYEELSNDDDLPF